MKLLLLILFCLVVSALVIMGIQEDPGTVLIQLSHSQIQTSLWTAIIVVFLAFCCLYIIVRILIHLLHMGEYFRKRRRMHRAREAKRLCDDAMIDLINGRFPSAIANFERSGGLSKKKLLPGIFQAAAAHFAKDFISRDNLFDTIHTKNMDEQIALRLTRAALLSEDEDWEHAFTQLKSLRDYAPNHPHVNKRLAIAAEHLQEWPVLADLLPVLRKTKHVTSTELKRWTECCATHQLRTSASQSVDVLTGTWKGLSRELRHDSVLQSVYVQALIQQGQWNDALTQLKNFSKKQTAVSFYHLMWGFPTSYLDDLILFLDKCSQESACNTTLTLTLGILCCRAKRFPRAIELLTQSATDHPGTEAYAWQAEAYLGEGLQEAAIDAFRKATTGKAQAVY